MFTENNEEPAEPKKNQLRYREKCHFDKPRNPKLNKDRLQCYRWIKVIFVILNIAVYGVFIITNIA